MDIQDQRLSVILGVALEAWSVDELSSALRPGAKPLASALSLFATLY